MNKFSLVLVNWAVVLIPLFHTTVAVAVVCMSSVALQQKDALLLCCQSKASGTLVKCILYEDILVV